MWNISTGSWGGVLDLPRSPGRKNTNHIGMGTNKNQGQFSPSSVTTMKEDKQKITLIAHRSRARENKREGGSRNEKKG